MTHARARFAVAALIAAALLLPHGLGNAQTTTPTATPSPIPTATPTPTATAVTPPSAKTLYRQSAAALRSVHWVHGVARLQTASTAAKLDLRITGDCGQFNATISKKNVLTVKKVRGRGSVSATLQQNGKTTHVNARFVVIVSGKSGTLWTRSSQTHNVWRAQKANGNQAMIDTSLIYVCEPLLLPHVPAAAFATAGKGAHVTAATLGGVAVWKIVQTQKQNNIIQMSTVYLDQSTLYWLRATTKQRGGQNSSPEKIRIDYSRYGEAVTIKPPAG